VPWVLVDFRRGRQADCGGVDHSGTAGQAAERESSQATEGQEMTDHIVDLNKMVTEPHGAGPILRKGIDGG